jgi:hypothetical protein
MSVQTLPATSQPVSRGGAAGYDIKWFQKTRDAVHSNAKWLRFWAFVVQVIAIVMFVLSGLGAAGLIGKVTKAVADGSERDLEAAFVMAWFGAGIIVPAVIVALALRLGAAAVIMHSHYCVISAEDTYVRQLAGNRSDAL